MNRSIIFLISLQLLLSGCGNEPIIEAVDTSINIIKNKDYSNNVNSFINKYSNSERKLEIIPLYSMINKGWQTVGTEIAYNSDEVSSSIMYVFIDGIFKYSVIQFKINKINYQCYEKICSHVASKYNKYSFSKSYLDINKTEHSFGYARLINGKLCGMRVLLMNGMISIEIDKELM